MLEVLEDYDELMGIKFVFLVSVTGQNGNCFRRHKSEFQIRHEALEPFSHQVPYIRIPGEKSADDLLELDPSSLPFYVDDFQRSKLKINNDYLFLGVLDRLACDNSKRGYYLGLAMVQRMP
ncbi:uncharacterized protein A4U43_C09F14830 [Asparagus officinalis]|uniref:DUF3444 domain-containing protein n=1 Tax=Asparagus officinalis TaxID=4686 RepID=A0A5P1E7R4_ASPOF|nr:uncharacterized protein A4U43_C09F14830 [Asparagus officinalis]